MLGRRAVEDVAIGQLAFVEVAPRAADEVVRLADRRGHDPLSGRGVLRAGADALHDLRVRRRIGEVDERLGDGAEVQQVRVGVDETGKHGDSVEIDLERLASDCRPDVVAVPNGDHAAICEPDRLMSDRVTADHRAYTRPGQDDRPLHGIHLATSADRRAGP
jgi:hypothetical protein